MPAHCCRLQGRSFPISRRHYVSRQERNLALIKVLVRPLPPARSPYTETHVPSFGSPAAIAPIFMLLVSNIFMTFAWYGHLKYKTSALWIAVLVSWGIAFFEYCLAVPANRIGSATYTTAELKTIQEVITLTVFAGF